MLAVPRRRIVNNFQLPYVEVFLELGAEFNTEVLRQRVLKGARPMVFHPPDPYNKLMRACWAHQMKKRPTMDVVCQQLDAMDFRQWEPAGRLTVNYINKMRETTNGVVQISDVA